MQRHIPRISFSILAILCSTLAATAQQSAPAQPLQIVPQAAAPAAPGAPEAPATEPSPAGTGAAVEAKPPPVYPSPDEVNAAVFTPGMQIVPDQPSALMLKLQVMLDRVGISPGVIDGYAGRNLSKAVQLAEVILGMQPDGLIDPDLWQALSTSAQADSPVLVGYAITPEDVAGPFYPDLPSDYAELAKLPSSGYRTPLEMFGERFHMNVRLLEALNPGADFGQPGTQIVVAAVGAPKKATPVASVIADKERAQLIGLDAAGHIVVAYPATIGSVATPVADRRSHGQCHRHQRRLLLPPRRQLRAGREPRTADHPARSEQSDRHNVDRPLRADLWHPRDARAVENRQDELARLRAAGQLGRRRTRRLGDQRRSGHFPVGHKRKTAGARPAVSHPIRNGISRWRLRPSRLPPA